MARHSIATSLRVFREPDPARCGISARTLIWLREVGKRRLRRPPVARVRCRGSHCSSLEKSFALPPTFPRSFPEPCGTGRPESSMAASTPPAGFIRSIQSAPPPNTASLEKRQKKQNRPGPSGPFSPSRSIQSTPRPNSASSEKRQKKQNRPGPPGPRRGPTPRVRKNAKKSKTGRVYPLHSVHRGPSTPHHTTGHPVLVSLRSFPSLRPRSALRMAIWAGVDRPRPRARPRPRTRLDLRFHPQWCAAAQAQLVLVLVLGRHSSGPLTALNGGPPNGRDRPALTRWPRLPPSRFPG